MLFDAKDEGDDSVCDVEGLEVSDIRSWEDFERAYWYCQQHPDEFATVILDTMSQIQELAILKVAKDAKIVTEKAGDWGSFKRSHWGKVSQMLKTMVMQWRDLPCNVVFIAQDRVNNVEQEDEDEEVYLLPEVGPALIPSVAKILNASVTIIGNTFIRQKTKTRTIKRGSRKGKTEEIAEIQFCLRIGPDPIYVTKIRKPKSIEAPDVIVDPTFEDIISIIEGR